MGALGATAIIAGVIGLVIGLGFFVEFLTVGGYLFFFTPFPLDFVLLGGVLWGPLLLLLGIELQRKGKSSIAF